MLFPPQIHNSIVSVKASTIYPSECRQRGETYKGLLAAKLGWWVDGEAKVPLTVNLGEIPIMVKVKKYNYSILFIK
jgi:DNA-directed RNA polymerase I subunit RPA2